MTLLGCAGVAAATASYQDLEFQVFSRARLQEGLAITTGTLRELKLRHVEEGRGGTLTRLAGGRPGLALALLSSPETAMFRTAWLSVPLRATGREVAGD